MSLIGIAWVIILVLKIAGLAFVATSWWIILFWPIVPFLIILALFMLFGIGAALIPGRSYR